jgi:hypothetical protein
MINNPVETKVLNSNVKGKDDFVEASTIQRHLPTDRMILLKTNTGHFIFCQENHPLFIKRNNEVIEIPANEIQYHDEIWGDNEFLINLEKNIIPKNESEEIVKILENNLTLEGIKNIEILKGTNEYNYRFVEDFVYFDKEWIKNLFLNFRNNSFKTKSYSLVSQLKLLADKSDVFTILDLDDNNEDVIFELIIFSEEPSYIIKGFVNLIGYVKTSYYNYFVYDVKTETKEYMMSALQNHNSFHTGGALILKPVNIIEEIMENIEDLKLDKMTKLVKQEHNDLINLSELAIILINKEIFKKLKITEDQEFYILPVGYFELRVGDETIPMTIEQEVKIYKSDDVEETGKEIRLIYQQGDKLFQIFPEKENFAKLANDFDFYVGGAGGVWTSIPDLYKKFWKKFNSTGNYDSVHMEIILSNILRAKRDPQKPARLSRPFDPQMFPIKSLPNLNSWPLGISFENFGSGIQAGLVSERAEPSPIEKVFFGEPLITQKEVAKKGK